MQNTNELIQDSEDEIDLKELFLILWNKKISIFTITTFVTILAVLYALSLPNIYTSTSLLAVANEKNSLSSKLGSYSSLAGMAGISLPRDSNNPSLEAIARIKSFDFFSNHFLPNIKLENLFAVKEWDSEKDILLYKDNIFDQSKGKWIRDKSPLIPSDQEAYEIYSKILSITENNKSLFVSISIEHNSPFIAQKWLKIIIKNINESMREENNKIATTSINFLNERAKTTNLKELRDAITQLLEAQMQTLMLASVSESYIYKTLDSPTAPERKSSPGRSLIVLFGLLTGLTLGIFLTLIQHYKKESL